MSNKEYRIAGKELAKMAQSQAHSLTTMRHGKEIVWLLVVTDERCPFGKKTTVSVFATEEDAKRAMLIEINEDIAMGNVFPDDLAYSQEECFAHTNDERFSYEIVESEIWRTFPKCNKSRSRKVSR